MKARTYPLLLSGRIYPRVLTHWPSLLLMALLAGWCLMSWRELVALDAGISALQEQKEELNFMLERQQGVQPDTSFDAKPEKIRQQLDIPWQALLSALDEAATADVQLLAVTPDAQGGQVRLTVEALTLKQTLRYMERLEASTVLADVYLASQQPAATAMQGAPSAQSGATGKSQFELQASWRQP